MYLGILLLPTCTSALANIGAAPILVGLIELEACGVEHSGQIHRRFTLPMLPFRLFWTNLRRLLCFGCQNIKVTVRGLLHQAIHQFWSISVHACVLKSVDVDLIEGLLELD